MKRILTVMLTLMFAIGLAGCDLLNNPGVVDCLENPDDPECLPEDNAPVISLTGDSEITLNVGDTYNELGALALDVEDGDISDDVVIDNSAVDTTQAGTYTVTYNITDSDGNAATELTRTVIVVSDTVPVITLTGDAAVQLFVGDAWTDPGATATDTEDGPLTVVVGGDTVDTTQAGVYTVTYNVTDNDGNAAVEVTRVVTVTSPGQAVITLNGDAAVTVVLGETWTDPGATASDPEDGAIPFTSITVGGDTVDTSSAGSYTITYNFTDSDGIAASEVTRVVTVAANTAPLITLNGDAAITIELGSTWTDPGTTVTDAEDASLTAVVGGDTVDTNTLGDYTITYNVTDSHGLAATEVTRVVTVALNAVDQATVDAILTLWDPALAPQFLGAIMLGMDFNQGQTFTTELNFEITEDIDEVHYVDVMVEDTFVFVQDDATTLDVDESHTIIKRYVDIDMNSEFLFNFEIIFEEDIAGGVHVYIQPVAILDQLDPDNTEAHDIANWIGFDQDWAVFHFDDSLSNVVEMQVLKEMVVSMILETSYTNAFTELQAMVEAQLNFDLNQYGVDFLTLFELIKNEDWVGLEAAIDAINPEGIMLEVDYQYVAWQLRDLLLSNPYHDLTLDTLFDETKLDLLLTAHRDEITGEIILDRSVMSDLDPDGDPATDDATIHGTLAFFNALTVAERDILIENIIKPMVEEEFYNMLNEDINPDWLQNDFEALLLDYQTFFEDYWPVESGAFVYADELALLQSLGAVHYWQQLTQAEQDTFYWAIDYHASGWSVFTLNDMDERPEEYMDVFFHWDWFVDIAYLKQAMTDALSEQEVIDYLSTNYSLDASALQSDLSLMQVDTWYNELPDTTRDAIQQAIYNGSQGIVDSYSWVLDELDRIYATPWQFQWWYFNYDGMALNQWYATDSIVWLLENHGQYIIDNYGVTQTDLDNYILSVQDQGGINWYLTIADSNILAALSEVVRFPVSEQFLYAIEFLEEDILDPSMSYYSYARLEEMVPLDEIDRSLYDFIDAYTSHIEANYPGVDTQVWLDDIEQHGGLHWFNAIATQTEYDILRDALSIPGEEDYRWPVHFLLDSIGFQDEYTVCTIHHDDNWCIDEMSLTYDLIDLTNAQWGMLTDKGYDVAALQSTINNDGAFMWWHNLGEEEQEFFLELAENQYWRYEVFDTSEYIFEQEAKFVGLITIHQTEIDDLYGVPGTVDGWFTYIDTYGYQDFVATQLSPADVEILADALVYPFLLDLYAATDLANINDPLFDPELLEFFLTEFFTNPHIAPHLLVDLDIYDWDDDLQQEVLVTTIPASVLQLVSGNMMAIDWDMLAEEIYMGAVDPALLWDAIYSGQAAYDIYVAAIDDVDLDPLLSGFYATNTRLFLEMFSPVVSEVNPYMTYYDDIVYAFQGLSNFEQFIDLGYYMSPTMMTMSTPVLTDDALIYMDMEMTPIGYQLLLQDVADSMYAYLSGFTNLPFPYNSDWTCITDTTNPNYDEFCDPLDQDIANIAAVMTQMGDLNGSVTFSPIDTTWMTMMFDLTDFADAIVAGSYTDYVANNPGYVADPDNDIWTGVNNLTVTLTLEEDGVITLPDPLVTDNANEIAQDFARFATSMIARDILRDLMKQAEMSGDMATYIGGIVGEHSLYELGLYVNPAFDGHLSTITVTLPIDPLEMPTIELDLVWIDGSTVFTTPLTVADIESVFDMNNDLLGATAYQTMVDWVDDTTFHMTKMLLMLAAEDNDRHDEPTPDMYVE